MFDISLNANSHVSWQVARVLPDAGRQILAPHHA